MLLSPLLVESYFDIAEEALNLSIIDADSMPVVQNFRMDLGDGINPSPYPDKLILGALSRLLENDDFLITELSPTKSYDYSPFAMRTVDRTVRSRHPSRNERVCTMIGLSDRQCPNDRTVRMNPLRRSGCPILCVGRSDSPIAVCRSMR